MFVFYVRCESNLNDHVFNNFPSAISTKWHQDLSILSWKCPFSTCLLLATLVEHFRFPKILIVIPCLFVCRLQHHEPSGRQREPALQQRSSLCGRRCGQSRRGPRTGHASTDSCSSQPQVPPLSAPPHAPPPALTHASSPGCRHRAQRGCRVLIRPTRDP